MKLSIVTAVLNSHEIVRRLITYYNKMNLPDNVEIIFMDDGSDPPLTGSMGKVRIHPTHDCRSWSEHVARNAGAKIARGEYLFMIDADYIIPRETIDIALKFDGDKMVFKRRFGILNPQGELIYDKATLQRWGLLRKWHRKNKRVGGHRSQYVMSKKFFNRLGGYREDLAGKAYPNGGGPGQHFFWKWRKAEHKGKCTTHNEVPTVFMFPNGKFCGERDYNPFNLFHNLKRM